MARSVFLLKLTPDLWIKKKLTSIHFYDVYFENSIFIPEMCLVRSRWLKSNQLVLERSTNERLQLVGGNTEYIQYINALMSFMFKEHVTFRIATEHVYVHRNIPVLTCLDHILFETWPREEQFILFLVRRRSYSEEAVTVLRHVEYMMILLRHINSSVTINIPTGGFCSLPFATYAQFNGCCLCCSRSCLQLSSM